MRKIRVADFGFLVRNPQPDHIHYGFSISLLP
jgi:hypothetical protein